MSSYLLDRQRIEDDRRREVERILARVQEARVMTEQIIEYQESDATNKVQLEKISLQTEVLAAGQLALPGFVTLADELISSILRIRQDIADYINDPTRKRPYTVLMLAPPGSGKSHLIKCIASHLNIPAVVGNLTYPEQTDVMSFVMNEARNHKALDKLPLLFFDEIDSNPKVLPIFLPLLWDGEFATKGQRLNLGRCVIICAVSDPLLEFYLKTGRDYKNAASKFPKLSDFLSRFEGGFFDISPINTAKRRSDKLCVALELVRRRFLGIRGVQISFLQYIAKTRFEHEVRSIEFFINNIPPLIESSFLKVNELIDLRIQRLLQKADYEQSPLRPHISAKLRGEALDCWNAVKRNTVCLRYDS